MLSEAEFARLQHLIHGRVGIRFGREKLYFLEKRVLARMEARQINSASQYVSLLLAGRWPDEFQAFVNAITVNETYFNREAFQFQALVEAILPEIARRKAPGAPIRIWCVPCSTGEEAYTVAIWLLEKWAEVDDHDVEIVGSDVDTDALERARAGIYGHRALQALEPDVVRKYFRKAAGGHWAICHGLRRSVEFTQVNICDTGAARHLPRFDVVFCRNLLIYFDDESRRRALATLHAALEPGGYCFLGHSDQMDRGNADFRQLKLAGSIVYRAVPQ